MIGLFDSGIGGLTVVRELLRQAPRASFVYLGDSARYPYGNKSKATIEQYAVQDAAFLLSQGATSLVVACNTASALAMDALRAAFPNVPIYGVIETAVDEALVVTQGRVGVIGTRATIGSSAYQETLKAKSKKHLEIFAQACPLFVPLVEEGWLHDMETKRIAKHYLQPLRADAVDTLILGCTHYPWLAEMIQRYMGKKTTLVNPAASVIRRVLAEQGADEEAKQRYFFTDVSPHSIEIAQRWIGSPVTVELATLGA